MKYTDFEKTIKSLEGLKNIKMSNEEEDAISDAIYWLSHPFEMAALRYASSLFTDDIMPSETEQCELAALLHGYYSDPLNKEAVYDAVVRSYMENLKNKLKNEECQIEKHLGLLTADQLKSMFEDYIRAKRSYDSRRSGEAERWLTLYHVDLSDEWIKPMVEGKARIMLRFVDEEMKKK